MSAVNASHEATDDVHDIVELGLGLAVFLLAVIAVLVAIPPVIGLFRRPGRVLATILWIS